jgi:hypothetical protein
MTCNDPSPPSAKGQAIISILELFFLSPLVSALQTSMELKEPLNLSGAINTFIQTNYSILRIEEQQNKFIIN